ncbi:MAG: Rieske (2Fe-2S) protein [Acidimicrobiia bacterium]
MTRVEVARWDELPDRRPVGALVGATDLVIVRWGDSHSMLYGRCLHRGALMADGRAVGDDLVCGLHGWDYRLDTGVSSYENRERLHRFTSWVEDRILYVDGDEIAAWELNHPQPFDRAAYQGSSRDPHGAPEEPHVVILSMSWWGRQPFRRRTRALDRRLADRVRAVRRSTVLTDEHAPSSPGHTRNPPGSDPPGPRRGHRARCPSGA